MNIETAFQTYFQASPYPLPSVGARVYNHQAPQVPVLPYVVLFNISPEPMHTHSGPVLLIARTYQFSIFSGSQSQAITLADDLRVLLDGFKGTMGSVGIQSMLYQSQRYNFESDTRLHHISLDFKVIYKVN